MNTDSHMKRGRGWLGAAAIAAVALLGHVALVEAHVGVVNTQLPYAVANKSYELVLAIPHGCTVPGSTPAVVADTYRVEVEIPAGFTGVRPIIDGVFGRPVLTKDTSTPTPQVTKLVWTKSVTYDSTADDQSYRIGLRGTAPNAPFTTIRFNTKQYCKNPNGGEDLMLDWSADGTPPSNQSPSVKVYPARTPGWNKFSLAANNEKTSAADVATLLTGFFADAQIVWLTPGSNQGNGAWSANPSTAERIKALVASDNTNYEILQNSAVTIHATDVIWAKF